MATSFARFRISVPRFLSYDGVLQESRVDSWHVAALFIHFRVCESPHLVYVEIVHRCLERREEEEEEQRQISILSPC